MNPDKSPEQPAPIPQLQHNPTALEPVNTIQPQVIPPPQPIASAQEAPIMSYNTANTKLEQSPWADPVDGKLKFELGALGLAGLSILLCLLLIFIPNLVKSEALVIVWWLVISGVAGGGLALGILSRKDEGQLGIKALIGVIISVIVCVNALFIGAYYLKIKIEINKFESKYKSSSSFDY